jgi:quercetin dioxygenase-like cupin family protein
MEPHDLGALLQGLSRTTLGRSGGARMGDATFASTPFTRLAAFNHGGLFVGRFTGRTPWERHRNGDELVQVLDGEVDLTVMTARGPVQTTLRRGAVVVVPRGLWHRQHACTEVTLFSATPTPTDLSFADDPRTTGRTAGPRRRPRRRRAPARR